MGSMVVSPSSLRCAACGGAIGAEEPGAAPAMSLDDRVLCPGCAARRRQALQRAEAAPTYRCPDPRHPALARYSFTTMARVHEHRRILQAGQSFVALPWPGSGVDAPAPRRVRRSAWLASAAALALVFAFGGWWSLARPAPAREPEAMADELPAVHPAHEAPAMPAPAPPQLPPASTAMAPPLVTAVAAAEPPPPPVAGTPAVRPPDIEAPTDSPEPVAPSRSGCEAPDADAAASPAGSWAGEPCTTAFGDAAASPAEARREPPPSAAPEPARAETAEVAAAEPSAARSERRTVRSVRSGEALACQVAVRGPKGALRVLAADASVPASPLPWPWPSGVDIHAAAYDRAARRAAIELELPGVGAGGGAALVLHPARPERRRLLASWGDGARRSAPQALELAAGLWQSVAVPAPSGPEWSGARLVLRLEDERDLGGASPFFVAGATTRSASPPEPADCPTALPLLVDAPIASRPDAAAQYRQRLERWSRGLSADRRFAWHQARILMPRASGARSALRQALAAAFPGVELRDGAIDDWVDSADIVERSAGWPRAWGELEGFRVLVVGWRGERWGGEHDLAQRLDALCDKALTAQQRPRRPALLPVLVLGDLDSARPEERELIDGLWRREAERLAARGMPVLDLTAAQRERGREQVARRAARLLADGLRQLEWMLRGR